MMGDLLMNVCSQQQQGPCSSFSFISNVLGVMSVLAISGSVALVTLGKNKLWPQLHDHSTDDDDGGYQRGLTRSGNDDGCGYHQGLKRGSPEHKNRLKLGSNDDGSGYHQGLRRSRNEDQQEVKWSSNGDGSGYHQGLVRSRNEDQWGLKWSSNDDGSGYHQALGRSRNEVQQGLKWSSNDDGSGYHQGLVRSRNEDEQGWQWSSNDGGIVYGQELGRSNDEDQLGLKWSSNDNGGGYYQELGKSSNEQLGLKWSSTDDGSGYHLGLRSSSSEDQQGFKWSSNVELHALQRMLSPGLVPYSHEMREMGLVTHSTKPDRPSVRSSIHHHSSCKKVRFAPDVVDPSSDGWEYRRRCKLARMKQQFQQQIQSLLGVQDMELSLRESVGKSSSSDSMRVSLTGSFDKSSSNDISSTLPPMLRQSCSQQPHQEQLKGHPCVSCHSSPPWHHMMIPSNRVTLYKGVRQHRMYQALNCS